MATTQLLLVGSTGVPGGLPAPRGAPRAAHHALERPDGCGAEHGERVGDGYR